VAAISKFEDPSPAPSTCIGDTKHSPGFKSAITSPSGFTAIG